MSTILISAPYFLPVINRFKPLFSHYHLELIIPEVQERLEEEDLLEYAGTYDATICGDDGYSAKVLKACAPRLKVISKWGTGIDSIDKSVAARLGILVCNTPDAFTSPVADSVMGYILTFARRLLWTDRVMKAGQWKKMPGRSLAECTLGVVGVGNIGKAVLRRARAFGMQLLGNDIIEIDPDFLTEVDVEMTSLEDLLSRSDFISLNCDLNPTSFHLINAKTLAAIQPHAVLINTARGSVVDEPALIAALQSGHMAGAALDVFEIEPLPDDSPLLHMDNVLLSPHNANSSPSAWERVHINTLRNLLKGLGIPTEDFDDQIGLLTDDRSTT
ncbi:MAG: phosphoglycerate dehydrogenase [Chloroflexota bacterium]